MHAIADRNKILLNVVIAVLIPAAIGMLALAFHQAIEPDRGQDFQWSGTRMVLQHIDPWKQMLSGDRHLILLNQVPNYLHETYLLLIPFGLLSFPHARVMWAVANCLFSFVSLIILDRYFALGHKLTLLLALVFFTGQPFRQSLANGQQSFFELLCFCCAFCLTAPAVRGAALGLSYLKYNFSPIFLFYLAFTRRWKILLFSIIPPALGLIGVWSFIKTPLATLAVEPFLLSRTGIVVTAADLMALTRWLAAHVLPMRQVELLSYAVGFCASCFYGLHLAKSKSLSPQAVVACVAASRLALMRHGFYDFIFLIVPLAYCKHLALVSYRIASVSIFASFWYGARVEMLASVNSRMVFDLLLVGALLYMIESNERLRGHQVGIFKPVSQPVTPVQFQTQTHR